MRKFLLLTGFLIGGTNAFASFINCTPFTQAFIDTGAPAGPPVFTCSPSAAAGNIAGDGLNVIAITFLVSVSGQKAGGVFGTTYGATATMTNNAGLANPAQIALSCVADVNGSCVAGPAASQATTGVGPVDQFGAFTVTVTGGQNSTFPFLDNATGSVLYQATTTPIQTGVVPEPATFAVMGAALLGFGLFRKRWQ